MVRTRCCIEIDDALDYRPSAAATADIGIVCAANVQAQFTLQRVALPISVICHLSGAPHMNPPAAPNTPTPNDGISQACLLLFETVLYRACVLSSPSYMIFWAFKRA